MNDFSRTYGAAPSMDMATDAGLRSFMLGVYNKMGLGLLISAALAYSVGTIAPLTALVFGTPLLYVVQFGPLVLLFGSMFFMRNPSPTGSALLYWAIVALIGTSLSFWVIIASGNATVQNYAGQTLNVDFGTIAQAFVITSAAFLGLSVFGYTTKTNLMPLQTFIFMGIIGAVVLGLLNVFFFQSGMLELLLQFAVLLLMAGVTAWQTQALKITYNEIAGDQRSMAVMTNFGALNLYIAFVNMFQIILSLLASRD
ncbi:MAG: Bax inhibitor-1/YccA family protein [Alphaproteobacteria bacterium]|nr:Bax inhibitor-1/YccA family protein [Alphaproteobacteria bacterium]